MEQYCRPSAIKVRLGEWDSASTSEPDPYREFPVQSITINPGFNPRNLMNDIAILKLGAAVPIATSPNINTVCLTSSPPVPGTRYVVDIIFVYYYLRTPEKNNIVGTKRLL